MLGREVNTTTGVSSLLIVMGRVSRMMCILGACAFIISICVRLRGTPYSRVGELEY